MGKLTTLLPPLTQLSRDMYPLPPCTLIRVDHLVLTLNQPVQALAQLRHI